MTAAVMASTRSRPAWLPLFGTPRSLERETLGTRVAEVARQLGKPLLPWQRHVADVAGEIDPETGLLAYSEVVLIAMRQQGKTHLLLPEMTYRCVGFPEPQRVLFTAQTADDARAKWRDVHAPTLLKSPFRAGFRARWRMGTEALIWRNGSMWLPASTTGKTGGTGDTIDMAVIDEAWSRPDNRTELGMRPAMLTRPWRQLWVCSMIPGLSRARPGEWSYLQRKRQVGRAQVAADVRHGTAFFDFTAEEGLEPGDPQTWWSAMPALGHTITEGNVRDDFESLVRAGQLVDFCAEYLGWEPVETVVGWQLVSRQTWEDRRDPASSIEGRPALAVEMTEDRSRGWIVAAGYRPDGQYHVEVVEPGYRILPHVTGVDWMERRVLDIWEGQSPWTVTVDPGGPASSLVVPLRNAGMDVYTPSGPEIAGGCGRFFDATGQVRPDGGDAPAGDGLLVHHLGQQVLDRAVRRAEPLGAGRGSFMVVGRGSDPVLRPLHGAVLALLGLLVKGAESSPEPEIFY